MKPWIAQALELKSTHGMPVALPLSSHLVVALVCQDEDSILLELAAALFQPATGELRFVLRSEHGPAPTAFVPQRPRIPGPKSGTGLGIDQVVVATPNMSNDYLLLVTVAVGVVVLGLLVIVYIKCRAGAVQVSPRPHSNSYTIFSCTDPRLALAGPARRPERQVRPNGSFIGSDAAAAATRRPHAVVAAPKALWCAFVVLDAHVDARAAVQGHPVGPARPTGRTR